MSKKMHYIPEDLAGLLANYKNPEDLLGEEGLLKYLTKQVVERALEAEMTEHLGHGKHGPVANASGNRSPWSKARLDKTQLELQRYHVRREGAGSAVGEISFKIKSR